MGRFKYNEKFLRENEFTDRHQAQRLCFEEGWIIDPVSLVASNNDYKEKFKAIREDVWDVYKSIEGKYRKMFEMFLKDLKTPPKEVRRFYPNAPMFKIVSDKGTGFVRVFYGNKPEIDIDKLYGVDILVYGNENHIHYVKVPKKINLLTFS